ncbi:MAG: TetR/AcrR family transcriptional regulator [Candidatus Sericytochromatia bacterium]|nr:TetR/AcrR family transcriptional regulator [Candidatus Sericytochromatia bacterium]
MKKSDPTKPDPSKPEQNKRDQIIEHVYSVFYQHGFHAAGLDLLLAGSGISKRTLYKYFDSKEALIAATVQHYAGLFRAELEARMRIRPKMKALDKVLAAFDAQEALVCRHGFNGCFALKALLEYDQNQPEIWQATQHVFADLMAFFIQQSRALKHPNPETLACQIEILFRGAVLSAQSSKSKQPFEWARQAVRQLCQRSSEH